MKRFIHHLAGLVICYAVCVMASTFTMSLMTGIISQVWSVPYSTVKFYLSLNTFLILPAVILAYCAAVWQLKSGGGPFRMAALGAAAGPFLGGLGMLVYAPFGFVVPIAFVIARPLTIPAAMVCGAAIGWLVVTFDRRHKAELERERVSENAAQQQEAGGG